MQQSNASLQRGRQVCLQEEIEYAAQLTRGQDLTRPHPPAELLQGREPEVYGDGAYQSIAIRPEIAGTAAD